MIYAQKTGALVTLDCTDVLTLNDLALLFDAFEKARDAGPFVVLTDTTRLKSASREVVDSLANRLKRMPSLDGVWLGDAVVIQSSSIRFLLPTLVMAAPPSTEVKAFDSRREAVRWCGEILCRSGVRVPAGLSTAP
jgi:hypothetical protein